MPDLRQMAGTPLPSADLPDGTLSVRVVRGALTNAVSGQRVELVGDGDTRVSTTDSAGRAQFSDLRPRATLRVVTVVDGEQLESRSFEMPPRGGVRLILAAGLRAGGSAAAAPGGVALGPQSRVVVEMAEQAVDVFVVLEIVNRQPGPVRPDPPFVVTLPEGTTGAAVLDESTARAVVEGRRVTLQPPVAPGASTLQVAYRMRYEGDRLAIAQSLPVAWPQASVAVRKVGSMSVAVPGAAAHREATLDGRTYVVIDGAAVPAGGAVRIDLADLPSHPRWPRYLTLGLVAAILLCGVIFARRPDSRPIDAPGAARAGLRR